MIAKSFVSPGVGSKGYVKAKDLTSGQRNIIRTRTKFKDPKTKIPGRKVRGQSSKGRTIWDQETRSMSRKISTDVLPDAPGPNLKPLGHQLLGSSQPNGKGGGILRMNSKAPDQEATYRHEMAHLKPKRNPIRLQERRQDPVRYGREEGRADFIGNRGKQTPGSYPGDKNFQRGYSEVQRKMGAAQRPKKATFATDKDGNTVRKSAFGVAHEGVS